jgi:hypothetical protein
VQPDERVLVFAEVERAWSAYQALVASIADSDLERPNTVGTWSGRDVVTHIANWEEHCCGLIRKWDAGGPKTWIDAFDIEDMARWDIWNEEYVSHYRKLPLDEVRAYVFRVHGELMQLAAASHEVTALNLRAMTSGHYEVHRDDLLALQQGV